MHGETLKFVSHTHSKIFPKSRQ